MQIYQSHWLGNLMNLTNCIKLWISQIMQIYDSHWLYKIMNLADSINLSESHRLHKWEYKICAALKVECSFYHHNITEMLWKVTLDNYYLKYMQSNLYQEVTFRTNKKWPYKTGDLVNEVQFLWNFLWQDKKMVTF